MGSEANSTEVRAEVGQPGIARGDYQAGAVWKGGKRGGKGGNQRGEMGGNYRGLSRAARRGQT